MPSTNTWTHQHMKFGKWGPTCITIWHNIESLAFFSKSLLPTLWKHWVYYFAMDTLADLILRWYQCEVDYFAFNAIASRYPPLTTVGCWYPLLQPLQSWIVCLKNTLAELLFRWFWCFLILISPLTQQLSWHPPLIR